MNNVNFEPFYNTHFIEIDEQNCIIKGWSNAFLPATEDSIILTDKGGYQFRLYPNGEENPNLYTSDMIPLYKWENEQVVKRTEAEIEKERASRPKPPIIPSTEERLSAMESAIVAMMLQEE